MFGPQVCCGAGVHPVSGNTTLVNQTWRRRAPVGAEGEAIDQQGKANYPSCTRPFHFPPLPRAYCTAE